MTRSGSLLVNLAVLLDKPTGISTYARNVVPHLQALNPTILSALPIDGGDRQLIPGNMSPADGTLGHARRLVWTQFRLPQLYRSLASSLLFSPVPEAPLWTRCRSVVMVHDLIPLRFPRRGSPLLPYFRYYIPEVVAQAEHVVCNSEATARDVVEYYHARADRVTPIPLACDTERFRPLDLPTQPYFLYLGRHDLYKNLERAIRAFAQVPAARELEFRLAGPPDERYTPALRQLADELGVGSQVVFFDYVAEADLPQLFNQALAMVFPSLWEGFGLPVLEAMACGTPVIASNCSSIPEVTGDAALLVDPTDIGAIATAMTDVAGDDLVRAELSRAGLARARQFSWQRTATATADVLSQFL